MRQIYPLSRTPEPVPQTWPNDRPKIRPAGSVLYGQGDSVDTVHLIERGMVKLARANGAGHRMVVAIRGAGWVLGAGAAALGVPHPATAETITETVVRSVDAGRFRQQLRQDPALSEWILRMLSREVLDQLDQMSLLALGARQRLLRLIAHIAGAGMQAAGSDGTLQIVVALKHREIAEAVWTSRETVTRLLRALASEGVVSFRDGRLCVPAGSLVHDLMQRADTSDLHHHRA